MAGLSVAVVLFGASTLPSAGPASAASISGTQAQVQALQAEVTASAQKVRTLTLAFQNASFQASSLAQQVSVDQSQLRALQAKEVTTVATLRNDAIISYTGGATATPSSGSLSLDPAIGEEYLEVVSGDLQDTADQYRTEEGQVTTAETALATELKASQKALAQSDAYRLAALQQASSVQVELVSVQSQLQRLEAAQAAEQARQVAAAARARQAAAAAAASTQGLPVNGGLVAVVQNAVSPAPAVQSGGNAGGVWLQLRECESGGNYQENSGNGFYGAYQFSAQTWTNLGYPGRPDLEPPAMQDAAAQKLQSESGWGQWPACSAALGLS
ncbi:MAG TPA: transglycosylase family protein [Acidimicrobiales bacterium]|jgi:Sec-independent protein translocase protein TatA|nr:transglycosylase family protein [Acidimicrobiales bacterium]